MIKNEFINPILLKHFIIYIYLSSLTLINSKIESQLFSQFKKDIYLSKNSLLITKLKIGSNNQEFNLILDTRSYMSWIPLINSKDNYPLNNHYNPQISSTSKNIGKKFYIISEYESKGDIYEDEMQFIDNYKKFKFNFGAANETKFKVKDADGIIGLAFNFEDDNLSLMNKLKKEGLIDSLSFSIKLNENITEDYETNKIGEIYLGKHEDFNKNEIISCPLKFAKSKDFCSYNLKSFAFNNSEYELKTEIGTEVAFDIASNAIILPIKYFYNIYQNISNFECKYLIFGESDSQVAQLVCNNKEKLPQMKFKFNGQIFKLPKNSSFNCIKKTENNYQKEECFSRIIFQGENSIIGSPFFYFFHVMFDKENKAIKFYPLKEEYIERGDIEEKVEEKKEENTDSDFLDFKFLLFIILPILVALGIIITILIYCIRYHSGKKKESFVLGLQADNSEECEENDTIINE